MLSLDALRNIAGIKHITNLGYAEKDYLLDMILFSISKHTKDELVFKGGTCLYKFYKITRFSEDIDFSCIKQLNIDLLLKKIISDLALFGIPAQLKEKKEADSSFLITLHVQGPLYDGKHHSLCSIRIDLNLKSEVLLQPALTIYNSLYPLIPSYSLLLMQEQEIFAEKIRAILHRDYARDVYDLWFLSNKGILFDKDLVEKKLTYYKERWDYKRFLVRLQEKENIWQKEIGNLLVGTIPLFKDVKKDILARITAR